MIGIWMYFEVRKLDQTGLNQIDARERQRERDRKRERREGNRKSESRTIQAMEGLSLLQSTTVGRTDMLSLLYLLGIHLAMCA